MMWQFITDSLMRKGWVRAESIEAALKVIGEDATVYPAADDMTWDAYGRQTVLFEQF